MRIPVYADLRWPAMTGIGLVKAELLARQRADLEVIDLEVRGRIGSPLSPWRIGRALSRRGRSKGVFWSPGFMPPPGGRLPAVVTVHDLIHLHHYSRLHAAYYDHVLRPLYRRCKAVICVSESTRQEFLDWSGVASDRVLTIYNGVSDTFRSPRSDDRSLSQEPYVLYAGNRRSYKNVPGLVRAYSVSSLPRRGVHLVLTGSQDAAILLHAADARAASMIRFAGSVSHAQLVRLYQNALAVAFVSFYEGFGLPILEGMAAGVPVLTSNCSSMPEVAGNAALLVDPHSIEAIAAGLERLAFDAGERDRLIDLGRARARRFDWNTTAAATWQVVASAVSV